MPTLVDLSAVQTGSIQAFSGNGAIPSGYLLCDGAAISRTTYARLFNVVSTSFGYGDNSTTFNIPDFRGRFLRGVDETAGRDPDKATRTAMNTGGASGNNVGSVQGHMYESHRHSLTGGRGGDLGYPRRYDGNGDLHTDMSPIGYNGGNETRPINAYVRFIIKY